MPKKSLIIIANDFTSIKNTQGRLSFDLAQHALNNGYIVTVLTADPKTQGRFVEQNLTVHRVKPFLMGRRMKKIVREIGPIDVVVSLTQSSKILFIANKIAQKYCAKHIQWVNIMRPEINTALNEKSFFRKIFPIEKKYLKEQKKCDHYVVPGRAMRQKLKGHHILPQKISFIPNWTNLNGLHLEKKDIVENSTSDPAHNVKIKRDENPKFRIIYAGDLGKAYPVKPIIEAAEALREHTEIEFLFVGDDNAHSKLAREREKRSLDNIRFIPYQPTGHYKEILESGDVHLVTLRPAFNGLLVPCKFYSSLCVARPVIYLGSADSEIGQIINQYGCGDVIEEMDSKYLVDAILKYRHDGQAWFRAQDGAINASQEYNPTNSLNAWMDVFDEVMK